MSTSSLTPELVSRMVAMRPALFRQAAFLIGRRTQVGTPDDFVQDTLVTALGGAAGFVDDNLCGWLMTVLTGHIRNASRRAHNRTSVPLSPAGSGDSDASTIDVPVAATQELKLEMADVFATLNTLAASDQQIIRLVRIEELSHEEVASQLGLPLGTLHSRLSRATARLRIAYDAQPVSARMIHSAECRSAAGK